MFDIFYMRPELDVVVAFHAADLVAFKNALAIALRSREHFTQVLILTQSVRLLEQLDQLHTIMNDEALWTQLIPLSPTILHRDVWIYIVLYTSLLARRNIRVYYGFVGDEDPILHAYAGMNAQAVLNRTPRD
jgi:hypothetical protein